MRRYLKQIVFRLFSPIFHLYFRKTRWYRYNGIRIQIVPGVFTPYLTFSTKILLKWLKKYPLKEKSFLELGSGTGLLATYAAKNGAQVTACDINVLAVESTKSNGLLNGVTITSLHSDLFDNIPPQQFDYVLINPPFYPKTPSNDIEKAWYCGEHFEYFEKLFSQLPDFIKANSNAFMVLSEDCEREQILKIAARKGMKMTVSKKVSNYWETNYIYTISNV